MTADDSSLPQVTLYTRTGCHLCDEVKEVIRQLQKKERFAFHEVDIDRDPELRARFNEEVPVIFLNGKKAFKYRVDPREFRKRLQALRGP